MRVVGKIHIDGEIGNLTLPTGIEFPSAIQDGELFLLTQDYLDNPSGIYLFVSGSWEHLLASSSANLQKKIFGDYTLSNLDDGTTILVSNGLVDIIITIPSGLNTGISATFIQQGTGNVSFVGSNTTLDSAYSMLKIQGQHYSAYLEQDATTNVYQMFGSLRE